MLGDRYQYALIVLGVIGTLLLTQFFLREWYPEYGIYQEAYVNLENFRSSYTKEPPPPFKFGIKQIVLEREDKGPPAIDRCVSCHVALQVPDFSPTKISRDINGEMNLDKEGLPLLVPNENYVWARLDKKVEELHAEGKEDEASLLESLKKVQVGDFVYDMTKVLRMHPLIGRETRPFEYHSLDDYGCVLCHSGNGRGLVTDRAHGPVFDGHYETETHGFKPEFLERNKNDPAFAHMFNDKPSSRLLFQTEPILSGALIQARCVQCHLSSEEKLSFATLETRDVLTTRENELKVAIESFAQEKQSFLSLLALKKSLQKEGYDETLKEWEQKAKNFSLSSVEQNAIESQIQFLKEQGKVSLQSIDKQMVGSLGSQSLVDSFQEPLDNFIETQSKNPQATGSLFKKYENIQFQKDLLQHIADIQSFSVQPVSDMSNLQTDVDRLTKDYKKGENLFVSQACYACHRIAGKSRGGVGPELTKEGNSYPWFVKESIVWPQADLKTSTMPNMRLDHEELEALVAFLLAQKGERSALSGSAYKTKIAEWEAGKKTEIEKAVSPSKIQDVEYGMTVFATEGCASCHRLKGYTSEVGYKNGGTSEWFQNLFPEDSKGSEIVAALDKYQEEIDKNIVPDAKEPGLLDLFEKNRPGLVESYYSPFKYAERAKNHELQDQNLLDYKDRVRRVLMMFVQEYGLGRLIGPRPNWSGVFRTDEWLMEHFKAPSLHVPRSIMPVLPFDDSKFYALTHMLDVLGKRNRDALRKEWDEKGFSPPQAYTVLCAQCHGAYLQGNGPVSEWIYPIPKNLTKVDFMRNLTRERVVYSVTHGVKGTPMPPWGEVAEDKKEEVKTPLLTFDEIDQFTDWLYSFLPGGEIYKSKESVPKWHYTSDDIHDELKREGAPEMPQLFDRVPNTLGGPDKYLYYIKEKYYTPQNIQEGQNFFWENCAACHGRDADGAGVRAEAMFDAKPRMLTNLDWIHSRDDLRLLRSIKYGVPGTSMTPWGDLTSAKQRLNLVMFIRNLTKQVGERSELFSLLFKGFDRADIWIEEARVKETKKLESLKFKIRELEKELVILENMILLGNKKNEEAYPLFEESLNLKTELRKQEARDEKFIELKSSLKREKELYQTLGTMFLGLTDSKTLLNSFFILLKNLENKIQFEKGILKFSYDKQGEEKIEKEVKVISSEIEERIQKKTAQKERELAKIPSEERSEALRSIDYELSSLVKLKRMLISGSEDAKRERMLQEKIIREMAP